MSTPNLHISVFVLVLCPHQRIKPAVSRARRSKVGLDTALTKWVETSGEQTESGNGKSMRGREREREMPPNKICSCLFNNLQMRMRPFDYLLICLWLIPTDRKWDPFRRDKTLAVCRFILNTQRGLCCFFCLFHHAGSTTRCKTNMMPAWFRTYKGGWQSCEKSIWLFSLYYVSIV